MTQKVDVRALAKLARLDVTDEELAKLETEIPAILGFVEMIQKASVDAGKPLPLLENVMRDDEHPDESGVHTDVLLEAAPAQEENRVVVKQVISRKK